MEKFLFRKINLKMVTIALLTVLLSVAAGCQQQEEKAEDKEEVKAEQVSTKEEESNEEIPSLSKEQAVKLINDTIETIRGILTDYTYTEDVVFPYTEEPDYEYLKESISPYIGEVFFENHPEFFDEWFKYCETDARIFPYFDEDIRFDLVQDEERIHIETICIANELITEGDALEFELRYTDGAWKLDDYTWKSLSESPLTQQEALLVANQYEEELRYAFKQEIMVDGEKCYEFIDDDNSTATVNSVTSEVVFKQVEKPEDTATENTVTENTVSETINNESTEESAEEQSDPTEELINNFTKPNIPKSSGLANKDYYTKQVTAIKDYLESIVDVADGSGMGSYLYSCTSYTLWDNLMNEVWADLQANMDSTAFSTLKSEQQNWLSNKESECEAERAEGGVAYMWSSANYYAKAFVLTEERCMELINQYMN